ncbi:MAG: 4'-phosphopantetheinyl transferase superfamily protein [Oscillospiraceae bacterium]|jgi:4'-phosphopantetheinyl transferase|nr:4'-phosphopantetheinyl transferase superfamily protein [Oscillospiraceae bacterium]
MFFVTILDLKTDLKKTDFDALLGLVSEERRARVAAFRFWRDKRNCLLGDVLARYELSRQFPELDFKRIEFRLSDLGKPFVKGRSGIYFNISHCEKTIACVVSDEPVGIDAENIKGTPAGIAERYFAPDEAAYIAEGSDSRRFYEVWTKKESRLKLSGAGLNMSLSSFSAFDKAADLRYYNVYETQKVICHVCSPKPQPPMVEVLAAEKLVRRVEWAL